MADMNIQERVKTDPKGCVKLLEDAWLPRLLLLFPSDGRLGRLLHHSPVISLTVQRQIWLDCLLICIVGSLAAILNSPSFDRRTLFADIRAQSHTILQTLVDSRQAHRSTEIAPTRPALIVTLARILLVDSTGEPIGVANNNPLRKDTVDILRSDVRCALSVFVWHCEVALSGDNPLLGEKRLDPYVKSVWRLGFDAPSTVVLLRAAVFTLPASERDGVDVYQLWDAVREGLTIPGFMKSMNTALRSSDGLMDTTAGLACLQALVQEHEQGNNETPHSDSVPSSLQKAFFTEPMLLGFSNAIGRLASEPARLEHCDTRLNAQTSKLMLVAYHLFVSTIFNMSALDLRYGTVC
ncbi:hypothetical protein PENSPDRAFT_672049 [Peniophora sp. CONT]|nr:hypothetical protein PENSPDRAFT_672049 [Peniophora sp. CONT]